MQQHNVIAINRLRPTQMTVGMLQVKEKRERLKALKKRPMELLEFILEHPISVVIGPKKRAYVVDHHHLALALASEKFETAPMYVKDDFSALSEKVFWARMRTLKMAHPFDSNGRQQPLARIPSNLNQLQDDPYRSLAGFVREAGGYLKGGFYSEFAWADFYRTRIKAKMLKRKHMEETIQLALQLAHSKEARRLPGYLKGKSQ